MLSISDEHKEAIIRLINGIVSDNPVITNLTDRSKVSHKLVKLIHYFEHSVNSGNKSLLLLRCLSFEALIENWLLHYYMEDSVMDSFDIEEGVEQELSTASLLILYVIFKFSVCFPHIVMYFDEDWHQLNQFNSRLDQMLKMDKIIRLLYRQMDTNVVPNSDDSIGSHSEDNRQSMTTNEDSSRLDSNSVDTEIQTKVLTNNGLTECPTNKPKPIGHQRQRTVDEVIVPQVLVSEISPQTDQTFECGFCHRLFGSKYKLKRHEFVHKPLSKPFVCPFTGCQLRFRSSFDMRRHFPTHTGERAFICDICSKRFSRADKLKDHKQIHKRQFNSNVNQRLNNFETNRNEDLSGFDVNLFSNQMTTTIKEEYNV